MNSSTELQEHLESFEQVEVLLFLRNRRDRDWSKDAIADALCIEGNMVAAVLEHLARKDLIVSSIAGGRGVGTSHRYQPGTPGLARMTRSLAEAWAESRVEVMKIMSRRGYLMHPLESRVITRPFGSRDGGRRAPE